MKAMIFAAGIGSRLRPITDTLPKALVPLNGKTLLEYQLDALRAAGIMDVVINVHHLGHQIIDFLAAHDSFGMHIEISEEKDGLLNTGGGLYKAMSEGLVGADDAPFLTLNVDILSTLNLQSPILNLQSPILNLQSPISNLPSSILVVSPRTTSRYLCFDAANRLVGWTNVATGEVRSCAGGALPKEYQPLAFSGMSLLQPKAIMPYMEQLAMERPDFSLIDLFLAMPVGSFAAYVPDHYRMMDVGKFEQLSEAEEFAKSIQLF